MAALPQAILFGGVGGVRGGLTFLQSISGLHPKAGPLSKWSKGFSSFGSGWKGEGPHPNDPHPELGGEEFRSEDIPRYQVMAPSKLGLSESELYRYLTRPEGAMSEYVMASASTGTALHRYIEAKWLNEGIATQAETLVTDPVMGLGGFVDVISSGNRVGDIKTLSRGRFRAVQQQGYAYPAHVAQVRAYQAMSGLIDQPGFITYAMAEDPSQQVVYEVPWNMGAYQKDISKLQRVRARIEREIQSGFLDPDELPMGSSLESMQAQYEASQEEIDSVTGNLDEAFQVYQDELAWLQSTKRGMPSFLSNQASQNSDRISEWRNRQGRQRFMGNTVGLSQHLWENRNQHYRY